MTTIVVIQQRLHSTRLPGKALLPLCGIPMAQHIVDRCKRAKLVDEVVVACPFRDANILGEALDAVIVAPDVPENDLIGRYYAVAAGMKADLVVRVSGDNPCVEGEAIDLLIKAALDNGLSAECRTLWMNSENPNYDFDGFGGELYTIEMLEWMDKTIKNPIYREHPHNFWIEMGKFWYVGDWDQYPSGFRLDVNDQVDYEKIHDIYEALYPTNHQFGIKEVLEYLEIKRG